ncbi:hypothetical protein LEL_08428 [Akanthomyces lecanii RCEF 1005]|uniref:Protein kinase-like domain protein n=1 Tax=Akanthomyces lecanii RCEF 1005 TaxID=1081108 RepID=A0A162LM43_CORDF|nr:hypothetical protein LEL_08428 [Akanthomyces lecanii RCEF 1005]
MRKPDSGCAALYIALTQPGTSSIEQGSRSYSVLAGGYIIQFREPSARLDMRLIRAAETTYGGYVGHVLEAREIGCLWVYRFVRMRGVRLEALQRQPAPELTSSPLFRMIPSFARFCASAWKNKPVDLPPPRAGLLDEYTTMLDRMLVLLPQRYHRVIRWTRGNLRVLFESNWPMVVNNLCLHPTNIAVDEWTGHMLGPISWSKAEISPFGMSLAGVYVLLGFVQEGKWKRVQHYEELLSLFFDVLLKEMGGSPGPPFETVMTLAVLLERTASIGELWRHRSKVFSFRDPQLSFLDSSLPL